MHVVNDRRARSAPSARATIEFVSEDAPAPKTRAEIRQAQRASTRHTGRVIAIALIVLVITGGLVALFVSHRSTHAASSTAGTTTAPKRLGSPTSSTSTSTSTFTTVPPGPGFIAGKVTAVGDSVMVDYQDELMKAIPGITVDAGVSRQWYEGENILTQMKQADTLGATVIVGLSTNGPITSADFDQMMSVLSGASHVIFVNTHVDQPWQTPNNQVLADGVARYKNTSLVDWYTLANANPSWFGPDQTHLAIDGSGTAELAGLIAAKVNGSGG